MKNSLSNRRSCRTSTWPAVASLIAVLTSVFIGIGPSFLASWHVGISHGQHGSQALAKSASEPAAFNERSEYSGTSPSAHAESDCDHRDDSECDICVDLLLFLTGFATGEAPSLAVCGIIRTVPDAPRVNCPVLMFATDHPARGPPIA